MRPDPPIVGDITKLPKNVPVDWFAPTFFNTILDVAQRARYARSGVALPPEDQMGTNSQERRKWKDLKDEEFMAQYGNTVLAQYELPTEEEEARVRDYAASAGQDSRESD